MLRFMLTKNKKTYLNIGMLSSSVSDYIFAWESAPDLFVYSKHRLVQTLSGSSNIEIFNEINSLTVQALWFDELMSIFYEELLSRRKDASFILYLVWDEEVTLGAQINYDDYVYPLDKNQQPLHINTDLNTYILSNSSIPQKDTSLVIDIVSSPLVVGWVDYPEPMIVSIEKLEDPETRYLFSSVPAVNKTKVIPGLSEEYKKLNTAYVGMRSGHPVVQDLPDGTLLEQLYPLERANILDNIGGVVFEGDLFLDINNDSQE